MDLFGKDFICTQDWQFDELMAALDLAAKMKRDRFSARWTSILEYKTFIMFFFNPSVRTRLSFEAGLTELGGHAQFLTPSAGRFKTDKKAGETIPVLLAPNMSLGVNVLFHLVGQVANALGDAYDIEITETHHRFKKDAPSGTALELARQICAASNKDFDSCITHGRSGAEAPRKPGNIGMHARRQGDVIGEHTVAFSTLGETVELSHKAHSRDIFARGALRAAAWLVGKEPGLYDMLDLLELKK